MKGIRVFSTLFVLLIIVVLSAFQMQLRGYEKIGRIEEWVIYEKSAECATALELIYEDEINEYYLPCIQSDFFIVKSGFEEHSLKEALELGLIEITDLDGLIQYYTEEK